MTELKVEIKNLKIAGGEETLRFELELYLDEKRSAIVSNGGVGGPHRWHWLDFESEKRFNQHVATLDQAGRFQFPFEQADQLVDELIEEEALRQDCQDFLCIQIKGEEGYRQMSVPDSPQAREWVKKHFPMEHEILNERFSKA